ncbi:halocyanin domain-containing protein [Candidatus Halobonum tyrrellensis G22]|uniref:Halocyanin domain-containing protein n=1 Tax=Candidatus Halobonum tyrrellensis G22 TaxID=1324957 RepID=V4HAH4_9EURY|nr:halocyanin domain-containing protein [Candidatus Halobonum tyrrellensis G22]
MLAGPAAAQETANGTSTGTPSNATATGTATPGNATATGTAATGTSSGGADLASWFSNTDGVSGVVDERGSSEVTVDVGASGNGGSYAFAPAVVRVDPGTTVTWEWTGDGGSHNVVAENGAFESDLHDGAGATYSYTPDEPGVVRYACVPHKPMGMKGALVVGDASVSLGTEAETETAGRSFDGWLARTDNYTEVVDERGKSTVVVDVGVDANGGPFGFGPAAVRVDPGTTVVWRWKGTGGSHRVSALDGSFRSDLASSPGHEFARTFDRERVVKYACEAHANLGMRGVVVVDDGDSGGIFGVDTGLAAGAAVGLTALLSPLGLGLAVRLNGDDEPEPPDRRG